MLPLHWAEIFLMKPEYLSAALCVADVNSALPFLQMAASFWRLAEFGESFISPRTQGFFSPGHTCRHATQVVGLGWIQGLFIWSHLSLTQALLLSRPGCFTMVNVLLEAPFFVLAYIWDNYRTVCSYKEIWGERGMVQLQIHVLSVVNILARDPLVGRTIGSSFVP